MLIESIRLQRSSFMPPLMLDITIEVDREKGGYRLTSIGNGPDGFDFDAPSVIRELSDEQVQPLLDKVALLNLPMTGLEGDYGCDGLTTVLTIVSGMTEAHFRWWNEAPAGWEGLEPIARMLRRLAFR